MAGYKASAAELQTLAKRVIDVDSQTQGTLRAVRGTVDQLSAMWKGNAAVAFNQLMERFETDAQKLQQALRAIAEQIDSSAATYIQQEEEATQGSQQILGRL